jgi:opacity protein-like surface antigen
MRVTALVLATTSFLAAPAAADSILDRLYVGTDVGVSIVPDIKTREIAPTAGTVGLSGLEIDMDAGVDWSIELGLRLSDSLAVELQSGYVFNRVNRVSSGTFTSIAPDPVVGGSGHFGQVPILANAIWEIPLTPGESGVGSLKLQLGAGVGAVNIQGSLDAEGGGAVTGLAMSADGSGWAFGYQGTVALLWSLTTDIDIGIRYRFMGTTGVDLGPISESSGVLATGNLETDAVFTNAIQASLSIRF